MSKPFVYAIAFADVCTIKKQYSRRFKNEETIQTCSRSRSFTGSCSR